MKKETFEKPKLAVVMLEEDILMASVDCGSEICNSVCDRDGCQYDGCVTQG